MNIIVTYDDEGGITDYRYEANDNYSPDSDELKAENINHRNIKGKKIDIDSNPPEVINDPDYDPRSDTEIARDTANDAKEKATNAKQEATNAKETANSARTEAQSSHRGSARATKQKRNGNLIHKYG